MTYGLTLKRAFLGNFNAYFAVKIFFNFLMDKGDNSYRHNLHAF